MRLLLILGILCLSITSQSQNELNFLKSLSKNNTSGIEKYLSKRISLCIDDVQTKENRQDAIRKIKNFISSKKIKNFKILHNGKSSDKSSSYRVARLKTSEGMYRIFAYSERVRGKNKVIEIRIDKM